MTTVHAGLVGGNAQLKAELDMQVALAAVVLRGMANGNGSTMTHMSLLLDTLKSAEIKSVELPDVKIVAEEKYYKVLDGFLTNLDTAERSYKGGVWKLTDVGTDHCAKVIAISNILNPEMTEAVLAGLNLDFDGTLARGKEVLAKEIGRMGRNYAELDEAELKELATHLRRLDRETFDYY
jgi:hypothetical protein